MFHADWIIGHEETLRIQGQQVRALLALYGTTLEDDLSVRSYGLLSRQLDADITKVVHAIFLEGMEAGWQEYRTQQQLRQEINRS